MVFVNLTMMRRAQKLFQMGFQDSVNVKIVDVFVKSHVITMSLHANLRVKKIHLQNFRVRRLFEVANE